MDLAKSDRAAGRLLFGRGQATALGRSPNFADETFHFDALRCLAECLALYGRWLLVIFFC